MEKAQEEPAFLVAQHEATYKDATSWRTVEMSKLVTISILVELALNLALLWIAVQEIIRGSYVF
ncbi:hypothetical protein A6E19_25955 [Pseudomonas putida]|nr:hypothetical protein A6E20_26670 [Pseudomonas putida]OCT30212.1 hypothetical protein A6E24_26655 [Pseudomonas putida]OCT31068.1 hypothetical protein A6E23_00590 [Pseudomonas putida]OCT41068.1 hypothetical protein A6E19_25955 [Pseudomonas putida]